MGATHFVPLEQISTEQSSTRQSLCQYPHGSIPCKVWNHIDFDCSYRQFDCIPPLPHAASLKFTDLSHNKISSIPDDAFSNLCELQSLDLSLNDFFILHFQHKAFSGLQKLQHLNLISNHMSHIQDGIFSMLSEVKATIPLTHCTLMQSRRSNSQIFVITHNRTTRQQRWLLG